MTGCPRLHRRAIARHAGACQSNGMQALALIVLMAAGAWLVAVALVMAMRPDACLQLLGRMASSHRINLIEQGLRLAGGLAMLVRASASKVPLAFEAIGWIVVVSSLVLMVLPLRWHAAYAIWWSRKLSPAMVRALAPLSLLMGIALIYASL